MVGGSVVLENRPGWIDLLNQIQNDGNLTKHQGQVIHGLMRHAPFWRKVSSPSLCRSVNFERAFVQEGPQAM